MKLADLLAGSRPHTLDFFPPSIIANVEKRLSDNWAFSPAFRPLSRRGFSATVQT
jgi:hypothetical protein